MKIFKAVIVLFCLFPLIVHVTYGALSPEEVKRFDELEGLSYLQALITNKRYQEALDFYKIRSVKENHSEDALAAKLAGDAHYYLNNISIAIKYYELAEKAPTRELYVQWGLALYEVKNYIESAKKFSLAEKFGPLKMSEAIFYTNCLKESNQRDALFTILIKYSIFDGEDDFALAKIQGFQFLNLTWHLENFLKEILVSCRSPNFYTKIFLLLDQDDGVDHLWEQAHACYPRDKEIAGALIKKLFAKNYHYSIAKIFHDWSLESPEFNRHTGEFMKLGHDKSSAYFYQVLNPDQLSYFKNSLRDQLDNEKMATVASSYNYAHHGRLIDEEVKQVLVFASLRTGNALLANEILNLDSQDQQKVEPNSLHALTIQCLDLGWKCRP